MKTAAIYTRVSTDDQRCERQIKDLTEFAERAGYTIVATFTETASGTKNNRKGRSAVMALAKSRKIDTILVTELSRWGRSTTDLLSTLDDLCKWGVSIVSPKGSDFDMTTAQGKMIAGILSVLSQFERDLLSERTKSGLAATVARGTKLGRPTGNRAVSKHAAAVKTMLDAGSTYREIASHLRIGKDTVAAIANS